MKKSLVFIMVLILVVCNVIGYSSFSSALNVDGLSYIRSVQDIRITDLKVLNQNDCSDVSDSYKKNSVNMHMNLLDSSSNITYQVTITNSTGKYFLIKSITESIYSNKNVKYEISGVDVLGVYQGSTFTFNITFTTSLANQVLDIDLVFDLGLIDKDIWTFNYKNGEDVFEVLYNADYKLEVWGAQGDIIYDVGYGGYSTGVVSLKVNDKLYVNVGGSGQYAGIGGYNGGGAGSTNNTEEFGYSTGGGGATHIALVSGVLSNIGYDNRDKILIVAGGGGGHSGWQNNGSGGSGGGYIGNDATGQYVSTGGTQTEGGTAYLYENGSFGQGGSILSNDHSAGGGGGGFFGGACSANGGGAGGSGYIGNDLLKNKVMYCFGCSESTDESTKTISTTNVDSIATTNYAKKENGYAIISLIPKN